MSLSEEAVYLVREELLELNRLVCTSLSHYDIKTCVHSHKWAHGTGPSFGGYFRSIFEV